jgi:hypothetical protein
LPTADNTIDINGNTKTITGLEEFLINEVKVNNTTVEHKT